MRLITHAGLPPGARRQRLGFQRLQVVLRAERGEHHACHGVMAERSKVQAVRRPHPLVLDLGQRPLVGDDAVVFHRDAVHVLVVDSDLAADAAEHGGEADVDTGEHDDRGPVGAQPLHGGVESRGDVIRVGARPDHVVSAGRDRDQVGAQGHGRFDLLIDDLPDEFAAHGEVRVREVARLAAEHLGDAVSPAAMPAEAFRLGIADPLGERVADRAVAGPRMLCRHTPHSALGP
jgi:hypothetical protein